MTYTGIRPSLRLVRRLPAVLGALAALLAGVTASALGAIDPSLEWKTIRTEHFQVHFHEGEAWTAGRVAAIAEEIRPHIVDLYDYDPGLVHFVILDTDDYANGAAYFYDNRIEIWATNLEFGLRGTTEWLRNVVTHEYTHVVSIQAAMKLPRRVPALYVQWIRFEREKRPDVINGYPDIIATYPVVGAVVPPWWAEGVAQYQSPSMRNDCWDAHRDMILRTALLADRMLTYDEMGFLGHRSVGNEMVYDHGYGLVRYIARTYGPDAIERIDRRLGRLGRTSIDGALREVTGRTGRQLYEDWKRALRARYDRQLAPVYADRREGVVFDDHGDFTLMPAVSPDGHRIAWLSNRGEDFAITSLYVGGIDGGRPTRVGRASSRPAWTPDGRTIVFGRHVRVSRYGARVSDLYAWDVETRRERRLTRAARAAQPSVSPDGRTVVCVLNGDGTNRLAVVPIEGGRPRVIFDAGPGVQMYTPRFSPDGSRILFGIFTGTTRDVATIAPDGSDLRYVLATPNDERDATWTSNGRAIVFASDRTGIFDLYRLELDTGRVRRLTQVVGGAFTPDVSPSGEIAYSGFDARGYFVALLDAASRPVAEMPLETYARRATIDDDCNALRTAAALRASSAPAHAAGAPPAGRGGDRASSAMAAVTPPRAAREVAHPAHPADAVTETEAPAARGEGPWPVTPYRREYTDWQVYPRVVVWDGTVRLGAFLASSEMLDRQRLFLSGSYGSDGGFDALVSFQTRIGFPWLTLDYFRFRDHFDDRVDVQGIPYFLALRYDLWSIEAGVRLNFEDPFSLTSNHDLRLWYARSEYRVHIDPEFIDVDGVRRPDQEVGWKYFVGNEFNVRWHLRAIRPAVDADVNPRGMDVTVQATWGVDDLFNTGEFEYGFRPKFDTNRFRQYTLDWRQYVGLPLANHTLALRLKGAYIDDVVDDFFWVYMGGLDGIRGYTYYTIGGRAGALVSATWRFPIRRRINRQLAWITLKDVYGGVFAAAANAWADPAKARVRGARRSVGGELRLNLGSFYAYPMAVDFTAAYALDAATFVNPLFPDNAVRNDPQWRYYLTVGFTF